MTDCSDPGSPDGAHPDVSRTERLVPNWLDAPGRAKELDALSAPLRRVVRGLPLGPSRDALRGLPIGHPLHPALVQVPIGAWLSATVLDFVPGSRRGARVLVGVGVVTAVPATLAGWVDWAEQPPEHLRTGLVHAAFVTTALVLYARSWVHRRQGGRAAAAKALGLAGLCAVGVGGLLGGHLAYRQAVGANKSESVTRLLEAGWHAVGTLEDFPVGVAVRRQLGEVPLLVFRCEDGRIRVIAERCSHLSGPLSEGRITDGCVECPWHGSVFRLSDGANVHGPATAPQPAFRVRVDADGIVRVQLPGAGQGAP
ncbi:Rieske 2Fe-2S domain-containing protein [Streptomyces sp. NPDC014646]|uniref:Rieske 2Fe-2S domain-containing protein n=1 Tax=unclassified Streptomyces TaxID=2593676 RepID=UPI0036FB93F9